MTKITESAQGENCTVRVPGHCNNDTSTTVLAHINSIRLGHGTAIKANDMFGAYCCSSCHNACDGRERSNWSRKELKLFHLEGILETQLKLLQKGLITCA